MSLCSRFSIDFDSLPWPLSSLARLQLIGMTLLHNKFDKTVNKANISTVKSSEANIVPLRRFVCLGAPFCMY